MENGKLKIENLKGRIAEVDAQLKKLVEEANAQIHFLNGKKQALEEILKELTMENGQLKMENENKPGVDTREAVQ